jgi:cytochrome c oxidase assembly protein subunit 15
MTYRLPLVSTIVIGLQMVLGGIIVGRDAGFVCPDWPLCHGEVLPKLTPMLAFEMVHRVSAIVVTLLVLATAAVVLVKHLENRGMVWTSVLAVLSLVAQVVVGGLIVIFKLPGIVTTIDVMNSMFLLGLNVCLTVLWKQHDDILSGKNVVEDVQLGNLAKSAWWMVGTLGIAILVGAVFRHTGASQALFHQDSYIASHGQTVMPSQAFSFASMAIHMCSGIAVAFSVGWFLVSAQKAGRLVRSTKILLILVLLQIVFGIVSLGTQLSFWVVTAHWANAAVLCALGTWIAIRAHLAQPVHVRAAESYRILKLGLRP